jgi:HSP20 family protein
MAEGREENEMASRLLRSPRAAFVSPRDEIDRIFRQLLGPEGDTASTIGAWSPRVDVEETDDNYVLHVEAPGVEVEDIDVRLDEDVLVIDGERHFYEEKEEEGFRRIERSFGAFHRALRLPTHVEADEVEATYTDGMLTITVPKAAEAKPRRIEVHAR